VRSIASASIPYLLATILAALFGVLIWQDTAELTLFPLGLLHLLF
jgi:hypothetical protein